MIDKKTIQLDEYTTPTYNKNQENCNDDYGCVICGKAVKTQLKYFVAKYEDSL